MHVTDFVLYIAMQTPEDDIFYQDIDHPRWKLLRGCYTIHEFPNNHKLINAYLNFHKYLAIGNATLSKSQEKDHFYTKLLK